MGGGSELAIELWRRRVAASRMVALAAELLDASPLCAIATVSPSSRAHVNTAYFAWSRDFHAVWMSEPSARHSLNLGPNNTVAIAVFDSHQTWDEPDRGIQLFGSAVEAKGRASKVLRQSTRDGFRAFTSTT